MVASFLRQVFLQNSPLEWQRLDLRSHSTHQLTANVFTTPLRFKSDKMEKSEKTVSDFFHFKQDLNRHKIYFKDNQSKNKFKSLMLDPYNAPTSFQADQAAKQLDVLIDKKSTNVKKMKCYKTWWWRRQARWQRWCLSQSSSEASSAEVANAKLFEQQDFENVS